MAARKKPTAAPDPAEKTQPSTPPPKRRKRARVSQSDDSSAATRKRRRSAPARAAIELKARRDDDIHDDAEDAEQIRLEKARERALARAARKRAIAQLDEARLVAMKHKQERMVAAAFLRRLGLSQDATASCIGVDIRTVQRYQKDDGWKDAEDEAAERWMAGLKDRVWRGLDILAESLDGPTLRYLGERLIPELSPPVQRGELTGKDGAALFPPMREPSTPEEADRALDAARGKG